MTISPATLTAYANVLVCNGGDAATLAEFVDVLLDEELPQSEYGGAHSAAQTITATAIVEFTTSRKLLAVFHNNHALTYESLSTLETQGADWQTHEGTPTSYTNRLEEEHSIRVYPIPDNLTQTLDYIVLAPLTALPLYLRLPAALWVLAREYERESDHRDIPLAKLARGLAERMFAMTEGLPAA